MRFPIRYAWVSLPVMGVLAVGCQDRITSPLSTEDDPRFQQIALHPGAHYNNPYHYLVADGNVSEILVHVLNVDTAWQSVIEDAITKWNGIGETAVHFQLHTNSMESDIVFEIDGNIGNCSGVADFPESGEPGNWVKLTDLYNCTSISTPRDDMVGLVMHELGHTLGFGHAGDTYYGRTIAGTPNDDTSSIMYQGAIPTDFSHYDTVAVRSAYPDLRFKVETFDGQQTGFKGFEITNLAGTPSSIIWEASTTGYSGWSPLDAASCEPKRTNVFSTSGTTSPIYVRAKVTLNGKVGVAYLADSVVAYSARPLNINLASETDDCPQTFNITVEVPSVGWPWADSATVTSDPAGINCRLPSLGGTCTAAFPAGTLVGLTAWAASSNKIEFTEWSGDCSGSDCGLWMNSDHTVAPIYSCAQLGNVYYNGYAYDIDLTDHLSCWPGAGIANVYWSMSGNVGTPASCGGSVYSCVTGQVYGPCDPDVTFSAYFYTSGWATLVSYYQLSEEIYQPACS